ncbi:ABC transporter substrate-binding protein [Amycolatopsis sp. NPDC058340]|uniref:ABC transporter substrate-binding protein n=1 Tax=Amycolatopsis sp. NPDC058340 TaxID=3346453 RepID=UPI0036583193
MSRPNSSLSRKRRAAPIAVAAAFLVTACGGGGTNGAQGAISLTTQTPPAAGDVDKVTWALPQGEPPTIDPVKSGDYSANAVVLNLCEPLMRLKPDFSVEPGLAESVAQPDGSTFVFTIRPDVRFWNGNPVTAADVADSLRRNLDPKNTPAHGDVFRHVRAVEETGPRQVTVKLAAPDAQFLNSMAGVQSAISEKASVDKAGAAYGTPGTGVMCSGPFKFDSWTPGERIVVTRNDGYWGAKAKAARFEFVFFTDDSTLTSALLSGEIDGTYEAPIGSFSTLRTSSSGKLYLGPSTQSLSIGPVSPKGPAADPRVREALDLAIDKNSLVRNVLHGAGAPLRTFTPPLLWAGHPAKTVFDAAYQELPDTSTADLVRAKELIRQAAPGPEPLKLVIPSGDQMTLQTATIVQAAAKEIGLAITIEQWQPTVFGKLFYDPAARESVDLVATVGYIEVPGVYYYAPAFALKDNLFNWTGWSDPRVETLLTEGQQVADPQVSAQKFVAAQKIFAAARLQISLASLHERLYLNNRITGAPASFAYISSAWAASVGKA